MAFNINEFKSRGLIDQGARPALFAVRFPTVPPGVIDATGDLEFLVTAASLPAALVDAIEVPYFGRRVKLFGERVFQNWSVTVLNDENFALRNMFESWSNKMNAFLSNRYDNVTGDLGDYKIDGVEVLQYGKAGPNDDSGVIRSYLFQGLWPVQVDAIPLDWGRTNQVETFDVTFSIDEWTPRIFGDSPEYKTDLDSVTVPFATSTSSPGA